MKLNLIFQFILVHDAYKWVKHLHNANGDLAPHYYKPETKEKDVSAVPSVPWGVAVPMSKQIKDRGCKGKDKCI